MNLTKTQVLALLLGYACAAEIDDRRAAAKKVLNGYADATTQHDSTNKKVIDGKTPAVSGGACSGNTDCAEAKTSKKGEVCGAVQIKGKTPINMCVTKYQFCESLGKIGGATFFIKCWADPKAGATPTAPASVADNIATYYTQLQKFMDQKDEWKSYTNFWVSPETKYTDGWYFMRSDNKYEERDWKNNICTWNKQCNQEGGVEKKKPWDQCCAEYPNANNKKCMKKTDAKTEVVLAGVKFTPKCMVEETTTDKKTVVPENAGDDIAAGKIAAAAEKLKSWETTVKTDLQAKEKYSTLKPEAKAKWDETYKAAAAKRTAEITDLKKIAGYDDKTKCNADCKAAFDEDIVAWRKQIYTKCKDNKDQAQCKLALDIRKKEETARAKGDSKVNYYSMTTTAKATFTKNRADDIKKEESTLAAAWQKTNKPKDAAEGGACTATKKCSSATMCCGTSTPKVGAFVNTKLENICGNKSTKLYTDGLGIKYTHACGKKHAYRLASTAAAAVAIGYSLL